MATPSADAASASSGKAGTSNLQPQTFSAQSRPDVAVLVVIFTAAILATSISGIFYIVAVPLEPYSGLPLVIKALTIIILGGVGSLPGALIAGAILGLAETFTALVIGSIWAPVVAIAVLFAVLVVRPTGLMGKETL